MRALSYCFIIFSLCGCGNFFHEKGRSTPQLENESTISQSGTVDFAEIKEKILGPYCIACHSNYANYVSVKNNVAGLLNSVEQNRMPKNSQPLSEELKNLLRIWVAEGANETLTAENSPDPTVEEDLSVLRPTWESLSLHVFEPKCLACHNPTGQAKWIDLSNRSSMAKTLIKHIDFKNPEESELVLRLRDPEEPMPPLPPQSTLPQLTEEEILIVIEWIQLGLP